MKNKVFLLNLALAAIMLVFVSCGPNCTYEENPDCFCKKNPSNALCITNAVKIELDKQSVIVEVGSTVKVTAVLKDKDGNVVSGVVKWESQATGTALVSGDGNITGMKAGTTTVVASHGNLSEFVNVTVTPSTGGYATTMLKDVTDCFVIFLPEGAMTYLESKGKMTAYLGPNDNDRNLWIWDDPPLTYDSRETSGINSFGIADGWMSFIVSDCGKGWSGLGYFSTDYATNNLMAKISQEADKYYLHIAYKTFQADRSSQFIFTAKSPSGDKKGNIVLGKVPFTDAGTTYPIFDPNFHADGEWNVYDIPFSHFAAQGLIYRSDNTAGVNIMSILSGGVAGTTCDYDAVFFYKRVQ